MNLLVSFSFSSLNAISKTLLQSNEFPSLIDMINILKIFIIEPLQLGNEFIMNILHSIQLLFFSSTDASNSQFLSSRINHLIIVSFHLLSVSVTMIPTSDNLVKMIILQNASISDCFCHCQQWFHLHHLLVFSLNFWLVSRSTIFTYS